MIEKVKNTKVNRKEKIKAYIEIIRIPNSFMMGLAVLVGVLIANHEYFLNFRNYLTILSGFATGFFLTASSMVFNDYNDREIDLINQPSRAIPSKRIGEREALSYGILLSLIGIISSLYTGLYTFAIAILTFGIALLYNFWGKKTGLIGNFMVSYSVTIPLIYGAVMINSFTFKIMIFASMVFLTNTGREIIKGIADIAGDSVKGIRTIAVKYGAKRASIVASWFILVAVFLSFIPTITRMTGLLYFILVLAVDGILISSVLTILNKADKEIALLVKKRILFAMFLGLIAFSLSFV
ncbi:geranylgeranylglycerol-phosphate geranylgeranyltransferase [Fervidicoccus fontis]|uniref:Geranylgeranylglycerol-phosphate geranylgeranyltransferase n=1 Tax=Fervidicoccus fontis TaxID=683846 RepID=A0A843AHM4_9CREN|nr:geranylgeranylglycerol-phosphate geranylgeranyltransferase [Fervidicoccus fontis]MBE9390501.1 geranylgeranylglycerol-phosphate geranylgeranyltransferase [Fervidicoccus fontis]